MTGSKLSARLPVAAGGEPRRILIVEDEPDVRETLKTLFEELGHQVDVVADGLDAVARLLELQPDVAFIDVGLPGIDGYEVARRVRAAPRGAGLYLIALTGFGGEKAMQKSREAGFDRHVLKPIQIDALIGLLDRAS